MTDRPSAGRTYTNVVLTVIATLLAVHVVQQAPIHFVSDAHAQNRRTVADPSIPATQDVAVAAATSEVAAANREIAAAIRQVASSVDSLNNGIKALGNAMSTAASVRAASGSPAPSASDITIDVKK
jgi:hypothetical protein